MGVTTQTVKQWLASLDLAPELKRAVRGSKLSATAATKLKILPRAEQVRVAESLISGGVKPTVEAAANAVRTAQGKAPIVTARGRLSLIEAQLRRLASPDDDIRAALTGHDPAGLVDALVAISKLVYE